MNEEEVKNKKKKTTSTKKKPVSKKSTTSKKKASTKSGAVKKTTTKRKTATKSSETKKTTTRKKTATKTSTAKKKTTTKSVKPKTKTPVSGKTKTTTKKTTTKKKSTSVKPKKIETIKVDIPVKKENKRKFNYLYQFIVFCFFLSLLNIYFTFISSPIPMIKDIYLDDNNYINVVFNLNKLKFRNTIYCLYTKDKNTDSYYWIKLNNNICSFPIDEKNNYYTYLKNEDGFIAFVDTSKIGKVTSLKANTSKVYLPVNGSQKIKFEYEKVGHIDEEYEYESLDENIATFEDGIISGINKGKTTVYAKLGDKETKVEVTVTNLVVPRPKSFDLKKSYLKCKEYSKEENIELDNILKDKINNVGYKTRAGVVEAARFLTLDFPYRINYFYENGRQTTNNVDGEGRYYHKGLYLSSIKYSEITGKSKGPKTWGCKLYSRPDKKKSPNGLDCSGFVSWALLNGGFNVKDVGAGWSSRLDLTDYGTVKRVTTSLTSSDKIKVGDLLHSNRLGGHIGIIVGVDKKNYYVAQAIWYKPVGVVITKIKREKLSSHFPHVVLMDKYYKEDGNLTNMW